MVQEIIAKPSKITIHCSASKNGQRKDISEIKKDHLARGFRDIGYALVLQPDGEVQKGRGLNESGAHVEMHNKGNIGICLIGLDKFTPKQFESLRYQLDSIRMIYQIPYSEIWCHYEFDTARTQGKTCPNMRAVDIALWYALNDDSCIKKYLLKE